jgi:hypothetical protein
VHNLILKLVAVGLHAVDDWRDLPQNDMLAWVVRRLGRLLIIR